MDIYYLNGCGNIETGYFVEKINIQLPNQNSLIKFSNFLSTSFADF